MTTCEYPGCSKLLDSSLHCRRAVRRWVGRISAHPEHRCEEHTDKRYGVDYTMLKRGEE
jgi:hypothetical protein